MFILCELAGNPQRCAPSLHIAGSKGKGSITAMISSALEATGRRPARYMSPHVSDIRERLCVGSAFFDEAVYCAAGDELREVAETRLPGIKSGLFDPACDGGEEPTYFELLTLYFFLCARLAGCDVMVVETGMGGRLDCTNVVDPLVSIISLIELEHTKFLGNTIAAVAGEKAGIIKPGKPLVLAGQSGEALEVFRIKAEEKQSPLIYFPDTAEVEDLKINLSGTSFTLRFKDGSPPLPLSVPVPGGVYAENAGLAYIALKTAFPEIKEDSVRQGLENFRLPARFELVSKAPPLVVDGAHTPESIAHCAQTFCALYGTGNILVFGCAADKNASAMARILLPCFSRIIITTPGTFRTSSPTEVFTAFLSADPGQGAANGNTARVTLVKETAGAIRQALEWAREKGLAVLAAGSFYLASQVRAFEQLK